MIKDSREEPKLIGELNLSTEELLYEDCVGRINFSNNIGECKIYVYSNEGTIPHFHIISKNNQESCICIYEPLYFNHGSKVMRLNSKQRKELDNWLNQLSDVNRSNTNWDIIDIAWKIGNGYEYVPKNAEKPNYKNLVNMRG